MSSTTTTMPRTKAAIPAQPAPEPTAGHESYKAALEDIAAVLRQSPEWGADHRVTCAPMPGRLAA